MTNIKIISAIIAIIIVVGGGYFFYSDWQTQQLLQQQAEAKAKAEADALAQKQAEEAAIAARTKCTDTDSYTVVTLDRSNLGQDILVKAKAENQECTYDSAQGMFEVKNSDPEYFKYQAANALVTDVGTGPSGRAIRLYDLTDKKLITEKKYFGELSLSSTTLTYMGEAKQKADAKNCKDYKTLTKDGLSAVLTVEKNIDLKTFLVKEGKTTKCIAVQ